MPWPSTAAVLTIPDHLQQAKAPTIIYLATALLLGLSSLAIAQGPPPGPPSPEVAAAREAVGKAKPATFKGHNYIKTVALSSSMSPGVHIASTEFSKF